MTLRPLALLALAGLAACQPGASDASGDESSGTTSEPTPAPAFLNPALGDFQIVATQLEAEQLVVQNIEPGVTQVLIDDLAIGSLDLDSPFGTLTADSLTLLLRGALAVGEHSVQLRTPSKDGPRYSVQLTMQVTQPGPDARPTFSAVLDPAPVASGTALLASGAGASSLLGVLRSGDAGPELHLLRAGPEGWDSEQPVVVPLAGHVPEATSLEPAVAMLAVAARPVGCASRTPSRCRHPRSPPAT